MNYRKIFHEQCHQLKLFVFLKKIFMDTNTFFMVVIFSFVNTYNNCLFIFSYYEVLWEKNLEVDMSKIVFINT